MQFNNQQQQYVNLSNQNKKHFQQSQQQQQLQQQSESQNLENDSQHPQAKFNPCKVKRIEFKHNNQRKFKVQNDSIGSNQLANIQNSQNKELSNLIEDYLENSSFELDNPMQAPSPLNQQKPNQKQRQIIPQQKDLQCSNKCLNKDNQQQCHKVYSGDKPPLQFIKTEKVEMKNDEQEDEIFQQYNLNFEPLYNNQRKLSKNGIVINQNFINSPTGINSPIIKDKPNKIRPCTAQVKNHQVKQINTSNACQTYNNTINNAQDASLKSTTASPRQNSPNYLLKKDIEELISKIQRKTYIDSYTQGNNFKEGRFKQYNRPQSLKRTAINQQDSKNNTNIIISSQKYIHKRTDSPSSRLEQVADKLFEKHQKSLVVNQDADEQSQQQCKQTIKGEIINIYNQKKNDGATAQNNQLVKAPKMIAIKTLCQSSTNRFKQILQSKKYDEAPSENINKNNSHQNENEQALNMKKTLNISNNGSAAILQNRNVTLRPQTAQNNNKRKILPPPAPGTNPDTQRRQFIIDRLLGPTFFKQANAISLDRYEMLHSIGKGSYAVVRLAKDLHTNQKVAIKTYDKLKLLDPQRRQNLNREIELLKKIDHANIIKLLQTVDSKMAVHLVMEYIGSNSLRTHLKCKPNRRLEEKEAQLIFGQLVSAVAYCHSYNIVHRDIKLENILLDDNLNVKLIDFGFAIKIASDKRLNIFCGTPSYMAPEIVKKQEYFGKPADIWALGILLYVLLQGKFPFKGRDDNDLYRKIAKCEFKISSSLSQPSQKLLANILKLNPESRLSARQILEDPWLGLNRRIL